MYKSVVMHCFVIMIFLMFFSSVAAATNSEDVVTNEELQGILNDFKTSLIKEDMAKLLEENNNKTSLTKEEITKQLIDTQKARINLLEGNINSLLSLLAVIMAVLALFAIIFGWYIKKEFSSKVEKVEEYKDEVRRMMDGIERQIEEAKSMSSNLNLALRELEEIRITMNRSKGVYEEGLANINSLSNEIEFVKVKSERPIKMNQFFYYSLKVKDIISDLNYWLEGNLPNRGHVEIKVTEVLGNAVVKTENETIEDKLDYYYALLKEEEEAVWKQTMKPMNKGDFDDGEEFNDGALDSIEDWISTYKKIGKVHSIIKSQIEMNPTKFKPKPIDS